MMTVHEGHDRRGRRLAVGIAILALTSVALTWAWKSVAVAAFGLPALGFGPALAVTAATAGTGAALAMGWTAVRGAPERRRA